MQKVETCRVCGSSNILDTGVVKKFFMLTLNETFTFPYSVCRDCQFIFQGTYVGDEFLNDYYAKDLTLRRNFLTDIGAVQHMEQSEFVSQFYPLHGKRVLEIGSDTGMFLKHLKHAYNCDVYFDELSMDAKKILLDGGIKDIEDLGKDEKVDVIVMRHLLEHIFDLQGFLSSLKSRLSDDGILFVEIPDWSYFDDHTDPLMFEHLSQFNSYNFNLLMQRNGFVVDKMEKTMHKEFHTSPNRVLRAVVRPSSVAELGDSAIADQFNHYHTKYVSIRNALNKRLSSLDDNAKIALYSASTLTFDAMVDSDLSQKNLVGIFDIDTRKHGKSFMDITIYPPEKLTEVQPDVIFLLTIGAYANEIVTDIRSLGIQCDIITWLELSEENRRLT